MGIRDLLGFKKIYGGITIGVKDMQRATAWYGEKLGLSSEAHGSNPTEVYTGYKSGDGDLIRMITLVPIPKGQTNRYVDLHPKLFTKEVEKVHAECELMGVMVWPIRAIGGNRFFLF